MSVRRRTYTQCVLHLYIMFFIFISIFHAVYKNHVRIACDASPKQIQFCHTDDIFEKQMHYGDMFVASF